VSAGTLIAGNNAAFGPGFVSLAPGTTLSFMSGSNFTLTNNFQISGDPNFTPPSGTTQTISGVIADGATPGFLDMLGPGTLVLSGANTYSGGTTISAGTLDVTGSIAKSSLTRVAERSDTDRHRNDRTGTDQCGRRSFASHRRRARHVAHHRRQSRI
jgi:autotransporter-associated beta strand protein